MKRKFLIWYMKPDFFAAGITGSELPQASNLTETHVLLKELELDGGVADVWDVMQAEVWSPNGEARPLIKSKGLMHTSMSIGDVIVDDTGTAHAVRPIGFKTIGDVGALAG